MNTSIQRRKRQIQKYTSHTIAPRVVKHVLYIYYMETYVCCK